MTTEISYNKYTQLLKEQGNYVITVEGINWYDYSGFMMPAYLPHCCPPITEKIVQEVLGKTGRPFARWGSEFREVENGEWWYVLRRGPWSVEDIKDKKKRWMIRRGKKYTPALTVPQVRTLLYLLLRQACDRRYPGWAIRFVKRKSKRRELARFHHYKRHKLLAPLRVKERK